jgi:hypothetical protein
MAYMAAVYDFRTTFAYYYLQREQLKANRKKKLKEQRFIWGRK